MLGSFGSSFGIAAVGAVETGAAVDVETGTAAVPAPDDDDEDDANNDVDDEDAVEEEE